MRIFFILIFKSCIGVKLLIVFFFYRNSFDRNSLKNEDILQLENKLTPIFSTIC